MASGANLITSDKSIGNSGNIIHSIDKVLYPAASKNIVEVMQDKYDRMARYLSMSGLEKDVSSKLFYQFRYRLNSGKLFRHKLLRPSVFRESKQRESSNRI